MTAEQKLEVIEALQDIAYTRMQELKDGDTGAIINLYADLAEAIDFVLFFDAQPETLD